MKTKVLYSIPKCFDKKTIQKEIKKLYKFFFEDNLERSVNFIFNSLSGDFKNNKTLELKAKEEILNSLKSEFESVESFLNRSFKSLF